MIKLFLFITILFLPACLYSSSDKDSQVNTDSNNDNSDNSYNVNDDDSSDISSVECSDGIQGVDGAEGFLWKPQGDSDGNLVILFPSEYTDRFLSVKVQTLDGVVESGTFSGFSNPDRQTWRFKSSGDAYLGTVTVDLGNQECIWKVEDPSIRND
jgi:hypothetical protein